MPNTEERRCHVPYGVDTIIPDTDMRIRQHGPNNGWRVDHLRADGIILESYMHAPDWIHEYRVGYPHLPMCQWAYEAIRLEWPNTEINEPSAVAVYISGIPYLP
jgi:hypothetical protein